MARRGLDLLIVTDIANQHYLTAYDGWSFYTPQIVVVPLEDEEPFWIGRAMDAAGGKLTAWMNSDHVVGFPESYVQQTDRHPMDWIAEWLRAKGYGKRRIGVELEAYYYSPKAHQHLVAGLPDAKISDASLLVSWVRAVKIPAEIAYLRKAARLAEAAMNKAYEVIAPGVRECDAVAAIQAAQIAGLDDFAGDITALPATILGGENASAPHIMWTDRRFGADETIALELAGVCRRYAAGLARTMQLGQDAAKVADTAKAVIEGMERRPWRGEAGRHGGIRRSGLACRHRALWSQEGIAHRLFDRRRLSARLGRAHDQPPGRGQDDPPGGQCSPLHPRHVDGWLGTGSERDDPCHAEGQRDVDPLPPRRLRQGLSGRWRAWQKLIPD